jgi:hypothetical protein
MTGSIGGQAEPDGGAPLGDCATTTAGEHPFSLHAFFSSWQTEPLFLAATMAVVVALDPWLPRVDLSPSWPDPSLGLWVRCEAARGRLGVGASLGGHGASATPSSLILSGSGGGHGAAVEAGTCAVSSGGVAGGEAGGRQGAGGGLEGQVASTAPPYPPAPLRQWPWRPWWRAAASSATDLPAAAGAHMVGDGMLGGGTLLQLSCTCLVEVAQLMADVGWLSALWRRRR